MLYFLHGNDSLKVREKAQSLVALLLEKKPNASFFKLDTENFSENKLNELLFSSGLFEQKYIVSLDNLMGNKDFEKILLNHLEELQNSENIFICLEAKVTKSVLNKVEKNSAKIQEFILKKEAGRTFATRNGDFKINDFNIFDIASAFGNKNKKELWILYQKTKLRNIPTEEVSGILFWQIKTIFQALKSQNVTESGLKSFVYNKAKGYSRNYSEGELRKVSANLIKIYHDARRSLCDFDLALEKLILEL